MDGGFQTSRCSRPAQRSAPKRVESKQGGRERDSDLTSAKNGEQEGSVSPVERGGSRRSDDGFLGVLGECRSGTGSGERAK